MSNLEDVLGKANAALKGLVVESWYANFKVRVDNQEVVFTSTSVQVSILNLLVSAKGGIGLGVSYPGELEQQKNTIDLARSDFYVYSEWRKKYDEKPGGTAIITLEIEKLPDGREQATVKGEIRGGKVSKGSSMLEVVGEFGFVAAR